MRFVWKRVCVCMENCFIQIFIFGWSNGPSFIQAYFTAAEWSPYQGVSTLIGIHCIFHLAASLLVWSHQSHVRQKKLLEWHIDRRWGMRGKLIFPSGRWSHMGEADVILFFIYSASTRFAVPIQTKMAAQWYKGEQPSERGRAESKPT